MESAIRNALEAGLKPSRLDIVNESHRHTRGTDTHFNLVIVSEQFRNRSKVQQHQIIYSTLGPLVGKIHALTMTCYAE